MKNIILLTIVIFSFSCSHTELIRKAHVPGNCEQRIREITPPTGQRLIDLTKQATTGTASIAIAGLGATTDALFIILTSPITKVTLCVATVSIALTGNGTDTNICKYMLEPGYNPELTQKALDSTKSWRCPNLDYVSKGLRNVASCYSEQNKNDKARSQLNNILDNKVISDCISEEETKEITKQIEGLKSEQINH